jgi:hypothetical protein
MKAVLKFRVYEGRIIYLYKLLKEDPVARSYLWMYRSGVTCRLCRETKRQAPLISRTSSVRTLSRQAAALRGKRALSSRGDATQTLKLVARLSCTFIYCLSAH